jgi:copper transporter 1
MMAFNTDNLSSMLYSTSWMPTSTASYVGTWFFLFFLAVIWRALVFALGRLDAFWISKHEKHEILINGGQEKVSRPRTIRAWRLSVNLPRAMLAMVNQGIAYLL